MNCLIRGCGWGKLEQCIKLTLVLLACLNNSHFWLAIFGLKYFHIFFACLSCMRRDSSGKPTPCKASVTHVLQPVNDCLATEKTAATSATTVRSKLHFFSCRSIGDWSATTVPKNWRPVGDWWAIDCQLIGNGLRLVGNWLATGRRQVSMGWRPTINQTIFCVGVIMNKALINCYSMAINISIMSYCLFFV